MKAPVALIFYNRPDSVIRVMEAIAGYRPDRLYLVADRWPEGDHRTRERCERARERVEGLVTWPCEVVRLYADRHLGCRFRPATGISEVLEREESAIILEDDGVPSPDFFSFCSEMLARYADDESVMMVGGHNPLRYRPRGGESGFFSRYPEMFGAWATWRRAWSRYDVQLSDWADQKRALAASGLPPAVIRFFTAKVDEVVAEGLDAWDFGWSLTVLLRQGRVLLPARNLIENAGFGRGATHTLNPLAGWRQPRREAMPGPYRMSEHVEVCGPYDARLVRACYQGVGLRIREWVHRQMRRGLRRG